MKMNPRQTADANACSLPWLTGLQKVLNESCAGCKASRMLFLSLSNRAGGITGWLTDQLEEGRIQAWQCLAADSVIERERWLSEDWCVTLGGDATEVFRCQSGNISASEEHLQISHHAQKVEKSVVLLM